MQRDAGDIERCRHGECDAGRCRGGECDAGRCRGAVVKVMRRDADVARNDADLVDW